MNLGEPSSRFNVADVERRQPLEPLYEKQYDRVSELDSFCGFSFQKKRVKLTHTTITSHEIKKQYASPDSPSTNRTLPSVQDQIKQMYDANDKYDLEYTSQLDTPVASPERDSYSVISSITANSDITTRPLKELPSKDVSTSEYIEHIPPHLNDQTRMRQLLYWFAQKELQEDVLMVKHKKRVPDIIKRKFIDKLATTESTVSWFKQMDIDLFKEKKRHERNVVNEEKLKHNKEVMKSYRNELREWDRCAGEVFEKHAAAKEEYERAREEHNFEVEYDERFIGDLDPVQQEFMNRFLETEPEHRISDVISNMDAEVSEFRERLNIANQFQIESAQLANKYTLQLSQKLSESSRIVPIDADNKPLGLFEDNKAKRKENELRNVEDVLRILSRQNSTAMDVDN